MPKQKHDEQVQQIPLSEIRPFKNHPFKVTDDAGMAAGKPFVILYYNTNSRRTQYKYTSVADSFISSLSHDVFLYLSDIFISRYCMKRFFMI